MNGEKLEKKEFYRKKIGMPFMVKKVKK